ncbi:MAG: hypothetical protein A2Z29_10365 [Chloroflexi bacterium RBG_16_56_11]|nr:MAG: hypothetical protein A2Z29_10365 [Chloroflexi bacterium RBG_16_56_11]
MRLRSTGLGRTELEAELIGIKKVDDLVVFFVNTTSPVKWRTRMGFQERDLRDLMFALLKPRNLVFILKAFFYKPGQSEVKDDF